MLKHLLKDALKKIEKTMLYSKEPIYFNITTIERKILDGSGFTTTGLSNTQIATTKVNNAEDLNVVDRISKFQDQLKDEHGYRIPLKSFADFGKINFTLKINFRIKCHLETDMKRLFELKELLAKDTAIPSPDSKIIFTKAHFIQYEQVLPDKNFKS